MTKPLSTYKDESIAYNDKSTLQIMTSVPHVTAYNVKCTAFNGRLYP